MVQGTISIIIPAFNAAGTLARCLGAVTSQDDDNYEVIVVNDGSTDATPAVMGKFDVVHIQNDTQVGPAISRNRGADAAKGSFLVFTDADCIPPSHWLSDIRRWLEVAPVVCGTYHPAPWQGPLGRFANLDWYLYWFRHIPAETDSFSMGNVAFHRSVYFERDRLEEHFFHRIAAAEDTIVAMTIAEQHRILSTEQLWVLHMHRETLGAYIRKHITTGYSRTLLSLAFPQRKVFAARDIRLSFVFGQLFITLLLTACLAGLALGLQPWFAAVAFGAFFAIQASSLLEISRRESSPFFWLMSFGLFYIRNLCWLVGLSKALIYVIQSPPELEAAARWRERQEVNPVESKVTEAQTNDPQDRIERAKAESAN
jgi:glycosyltransferase involved in cell wall biosynthesis